MGYIYLRTNKINGKKYVGLTTNLKTRQNRWKCLSKEYAGSAINAAKAKYGVDAFDFEILRECNDDELDYWEKYYIKELNTKAPYGYNLTEGGEGCKGCFPTEETRKKLSISIKKSYTEERRKKLSKTLKGRKFSEEHKKHLSEARKGVIFTKEWIKNLCEAQKGRKHSEETKKKIGEANKRRTFSEETRKKLSESHKGEKHHFYGKHFSEEHKKHLSEAHKNNPIKSKTIIQLNKNTNEVIAEFPSTAEVERQLGFDHSAIGRCCLGKQETSYGFIWRYKESAA